MGPSRPIVAVAIATAFGGVACSLLTHAFDFQNGTPPDVTPTFPGPCGTCAAKPDFTRLTCVDDDGGAPGNAPTRYYALDALQLGTHGITSDSYDVGVSQDCSDRPDGAPALCSTPPIMPFPTLPHGIENAFATQLLAPMEEAFPPSSGIDVETRVNAWIAAGLGGFVLGIDGWDGQTDGPVRVRISRVVGAGPVVDTPAGTSTSAQIVGGTLNAVFAPLTSIFLYLGDTSGALLRVQVEGFRIRGVLADNATSSVLLSGYLGTNGQLGQNFGPGIAELVLGCGAYETSDGGIAAGIARVGSLLMGAYDLPDPSHACDKGVCGPCVGMSFGLAAHATRLASAPMPGTPTDDSCADSGAPDASVDAGSSADATTTDATATD